MADHAGYKSFAARLSTLGRFEYLDPPPPSKREPSTVERLLEAGVVDTSDEAERVAEHMRRVANAGCPVSVDDFITALGRGSALSLDNLGLIVDVDPPPEPSVDLVARLLRAYGPQNRETAVRTAEAIVRHRTRPQRAAGFLRRTFVTIDDAVMFNQAISVGYTISERAR